MISESDVIEMPVTTPIMTKAHAMSVDMGVLKTSITGGEGNLAGFIGEGLVHQYLLDNGGIVSWENTYEYDMILNGEIRIDVKSKRTSVKPKLNYECSVKDGKRQDCDIYVFTRVKNDFSVGWLLGYMPAKEYFEVANFMEKGTIDPSNGWKVSKDCYNLPIDELRNMNELTTEDSGTGHRD